MRLWDIDRNKVIAKWTKHAKAVRSVCWSRDGQRVMSGSYDGIAREWDVEKGETRHENVFATAEGTFSITDSESTVKIWDAKTGKLVAALKR